MEEHWDFLGFEKLDPMISTGGDPQVEEDWSSPRDLVSSSGIIASDDHETQHLLAEEDAQTAVDLVAVSAIADIPGMSSAGVDKVPWRKKARYGDNNVAVPWASTFFMCQQEV